jgi:hypothetical protein
MKIKRTSTRIRRKVVPVQSMKTCVREGVQLRELIFSVGCMWEKHPIPIVQKHPRFWYQYASNFTLQTLYSGGKGPLYPFDRKIYGPQGRPGHSSGMKEIPVPEEKQTMAIQPMARQVDDRVYFL